VSQASTDFARFFVCGGSSGLAPMGGGRLIEFPQ
jgi:hypothetical protein